VFVVSDRSNPSQRAVVAKLVFPAEVMADLAQMIPADRPEPVFVRLTGHSAAWCTITLPAIRRYRRRRSR
jgi:hypothetical protein